MEERQSMGSLLVQFGLISEPVLEEALEAQRQTGRRLGEILVDLGHVTQQDIEWTLSKQLDIPFIIVDEASLDKDLLVHFPMDFLMANRILPMYETSDTVAVVTDDPFNKEAFAEVERLRDKRVNVSSGNGEAIEELLGKLYRKDTSLELVGVLKQIVERLRGTCYYRLDFACTETEFGISAFGFGMRREMHKSAPIYSKADVLGALSALQTGFLFRELMPTDGKGFFLAAYAVERGLQPGAYPVVLGSYGLKLPEGPVFTSLQSLGIQGVYTSSVPVAGYMYFYPEKTPNTVEEALFTVDSAPVEFKNFHLHLHVPRYCHQCEGAGCEACGYMGYTFKPVDGVYSYSDLIKFLREG